MQVLRCQIGDLVPRHIRLLDVHCEKVKVFLADLVNLVGNLLEHVELIELFRFVGVLIWNLVQAARSPFEVIRTVPAFNNQHLPTLQAEAIVCQYSRLDEVLLPLEVVDKTIFRTVGHHQGI
jgi:hypothetical protein